MYWYTGMHNVVSLGDRFCSLFGTVLMLKNEKNRHRCTVIFIVFVLNITYSAPREVAVLTTFFGRAELVHPELVHPFWGTGKMGFN